MRKALLPAGTVRFDGTAGGVITGPAACIAALAAARTTALADIDNEVRYVMATSPAREARASWVRAGGRGVDAHQENRKQAGKSDSDSGASRTLRTDGDLLDDGWLVR